MPEGEAVRGSRGLTQAPPIGLERLPREVRSLLEEAAGNATQAAGELTQLLERADRELRATIERREQEGDRITHDLKRALRAPRLASQDRGRVLALGESVDDLVDAIDAASSKAVRCDCRPEARLLAQVLRDMARAAARALELLDGPPADRERELRSMHQLRKEGERISRTAVADLMKGGGEPLAVIAHKDCVELLAEALAAAWRVAESVRRADLVVRG